MSEPLNGVEELSIGSCKLRRLCPGDEERLARYFASLSGRTKSLYAPHSFDRECAMTIPLYDQMAAEVERYILVRNDAIKGYFIVDYHIPLPLFAYYRARGITLRRGEDAQLAPSLLDEMQGQGWGLRIMDELAPLLQKRGLRALVLMGGVMAENTNARRFYEKCGFVTIGAFRTQTLNYHMRLVFNQQNQ